MDLQFPGALTHFLTATHFTRVNITKVFFFVAALSFCLGLTLASVGAFATAHPPLPLSGSTRGISLAGLRSFCCHRERSLPAGPQSSFPVFSECQLHCSQQSNLRSVKPLEIVNFQVTSATIDPPAEKVIPLTEIKQNDVIIYSTPDNWS